MDDFNANAKSMWHFGLGIEISVVTRKFLGFVYVEIKQYLRIEINGKWLIM